ncbi:GNAT family N-acetyltransferase [Aliirhizobium smilacinae]|nr:GNAT family N-acetyltransferase [Rhizobium smilacinae]
MLPFGELEIALVRDVSLIEDEWRRLEGREWNSLNQGLDWCRAWTAAHQSDLLAVTGSIGPRIQFLLPLEIIRGRLGRIARLPGGRFNNISTGLFDEALAAPNADKLRQFKAALARSLRNAADLVVIDEVPLAWKGITHPLSGLASIENQNHSFQLPLFATMEATLSQVNAKARRKKYRVQVRRLEAIGGFDYVVAHAAEEQHALLDRFFAQKSERLKAFGLPDVFAAAQTRDFLHRLLDAPQRGQDKPLSMHAIRLKGEHDGHIAAVTGLSRKGGHVLCQFSSIDDSVGADASPGELLFWLAIERSIEDGATLFDFGIGDQPYKRSWCSQETVQHDMLLPISARGSALAYLHLGKTGIKTAIKRNHRLYAMAQRWRSRHGGQD